MPLPLVLRDRPFEPAHGALLRLCMRNGGVVVSSFAASVGLKARDVLAGRGVEVIADLAAIAPTPLGWWSPIVARPERIVSIAGEELALGDWSITQRRHCARCLLDDVADAARASVPPDWLASHRAWWDVSSIAACPVHGIALVGECPSCGACLGWRDARRLECPRCLSDLLSEPETIDDPLGRYVAARLGVGRVERPPMLEELPLRHAIRLCAKLGRAGLDAPPAPTTCGVPPPEVGAEGFRRALRGSAALDDVLDRVLSRRDPDGPDGLGGAYGWLHGEWLGTDDPSGAPLREALRLHAVANGVIAENEERLGATPPATITLTQAAAQAGVAIARMRRVLDEADEIPSGSRRGVAFALDADVIRLTPRSKGARRRVAKQILGVGRTALSGLAAAGYIDVADEDSLRASATGLMTAVDRQLCAGTAPKGVSTVPEATVAVPVALPRVIDALLQGTIPAWRGDEGTGLAAILVRAQDLMPLRARPDGFSGAAAARALGLHQDCVRALIRGGDLARGEDGLIQSDAVTRFRAEFVLGTELARDRTCSPAWLVARLAKVGIQPAWPIATHRQALFRRSDLRRLDGSAT